MEVIGITRWRSRLENIEHILDKIHLVECDIRDLSSWKKTLDSVKPERIFHLAAKSFVLTSWHAPQETLTTNLTGELNLFEAVRELNLECRIQIACSSEEYGMVYENELPIKETNPLRPLSPYDVSKVGQDLLAYQYFKSYGTDVIRTRGFNHTGPRRGDVFVTSNFARQVAEISKGKKPPVIHVGNLEAIRDFTHVKDTVRGYWMALDSGEAGEAYNICYGKGYAISEILDMLVKEAGVEVEIKQDPARMRPSDVPVLVGDNSKFSKATGWKPEIPMEKTVKEIYKFWLDRV